MLLRIESLAYGIFGVARAEGGVVFVPGTAPGDVVRARVVKEQAGYREAEVVEIVERSPVRRTPPCPYVDECGGCSWQHVEYAAQLAAKEAVLRETLARIGKLDPAALDIRPIIGSAEWAYRHRLTLRVGGEHRLGFYRHHSHLLVEIDECLIGDETVNRHMSVAREWLRGVSTTVRRLEIASNRSGKVAFVANAEGAFRHDEAFHEKFLREHDTVAGIVLFGKGWRRTFGKPIVDLEIDGGLVIDTQGGFTQVNPEGNRKLVVAALELGAPQADDRMLDLYCGAGNFTLPFARRVREVVGVESEAASVMQARRNADRAGLANCRFIQQEAAAAARGLAADGERFSLVVLDPPRSGAAGVVEHLPALAGDRVVYVSCNPATLARDLGKLASFGFTIGAIQPVDLFPQTYHLETVVRLRR